MFISLASGLWTQASDFSSLISHLSSLASGLWTPCLPECNAGRWTLESFYYTCFMSLTLIIILITVGISILSFRNYDLKYKLIFSPTIIIERNEWFRFLTSGFIHADYVHLGVNMFVLYFFGTAVEESFEYSLPLGGFKYILLYMLTIVLANVKTFYKEQRNDAYFSLGASGGVSGVLFSYIALDPFSTLYLYAFIPVPGYILGPLYLLYSSYMSKRGLDNINHDAHLCGAVVGLVYTIILRPDVVTRYFA